MKGRLNQATRTRYSHPPRGPRMLPDWTSESSMIKRIAFLVVGALLVGLAGLGVGNLVGFNPFRVDEVDRSQPVLLKSITDISEYHAAVGNFEVVIDIEDAKEVSWVPDFITGRRTLFVAAGTVNAYVDLSGLRDKDLTLSADGKSVTVRLPEPQLDKPNLDNERTYMFSQERGLAEMFVDSVETPEQQQFYTAAEAKIAA